MSPEWMEWIEENMPAAMLEEFKAAWKHEGRWRDNHIAAIEAELAIYTKAQVQFGGRGPIKCHQLIADAFNMLRDTLDGEIEPEFGPHPLRACIAALEAELFAVKRERDEAKEAELRERIHARECCQERDEARARCERLETLLPMIIAVRDAKSGTFQSRNAWKALNNGLAVLAECEEGK